MARRRGRAASTSGAAPAAALLCATFVAAVSPARAQSVVGGFDDASLPAAGEARLRFGVRLEGTTSQFGGLTGTGGRVPLGARFSYDSLGASRLPFVAATQRVLQDSVGVGTGLTLGAVRTGARTLVTRVPFTLDFGLTRRIALGVTASIVRTRASVQLDVNPGGVGGNLGFNPANGDVSTGTTTAARQDALVQTQLTSAASHLASLLSTCPTTSGAGTPPECDPVIANRAAAEQLVQTTRRVAAGLAAIYGAGTTSAQGAFLVPIQGTEPQRAVEARIKALGTQFAAFQITDLANPALPVPSTVRLAAAGLQRILTEEPFGIRADTVRGIAFQGPGDVEIAAHVMWLDTFGPLSATPVGVHVRSTASASYRLATGSLDLPFDFFDVPTGAGSPALLLRSATDVAVGRKLFVSAVARLESPFSRQVTVRVPYGPGEVLAPAERELVATRAPGRQMSVELTPRWRPTDAFTIAAHYELRSKSEDRFTGTISATDPFTGPFTVDASALDVGTGGRAQIAGFGVTYSTLGSYARGRTWLPAEVSYLHTSTVAGSGGIVPATRYDEFAIRIYTQILGRGTRRAPTTTR